MALSDNIYSRRVALGLTQTQLAEKVGVAYQTIQKFENNTRKPTPEVFVMLARELGTTCEKLVLGENAGR